MPVWEEWETLLRHRLTQLEEVKREYDEADKAVQTYTLRKRELMRELMDRMAVIERLQAQIAEAKKLNY